MFKTALLCFFLAIFSFSVAQTSCYRIAFWNVENLFDARHDTLKNDFDFTPQGQYHWTDNKLQRKCNQIYKVITAMGWDDVSLCEASLPAVVGLAEVENDFVLKRLCLATPLRKAGYKYLHFESPDERGIDVALLYRSDLLRVAESHPIVVSDTAERFFTRDILSALVVTKTDDTLLLFVCHLPSKRSGEKATANRNKVAAVLRREMDLARRLHPHAAVIAMGDFNATPTEECVTKHLGISPSDSIPYFNLVGSTSSDAGTYYFQGCWSCLDQAFISHNLMDGTLPLQLIQSENPIFRCPPLLTNDPKLLSDKPARTYAGPRYLGGPSDHLPLCFILAR